MSKIIFHIDVNNAYLSRNALKLLDEGGTVDLREVPSIVGGDRETRHGGDAVRIYSPPLAGVQPKTAFPIFME